jgi:hypothetical protein
MFQCITKIAATIPEPRETLANVCTPIAHRLAKPTDAIAVTLALEVVRDCAVDAWRFLWESLWPSLQALATEAISNQAVDLGFLSLVLQAVTALITRLPWEEAGPIVLMLLELMVTRGRFPAPFFVLLEQLAKHFEAEMRELSEGIFSSFIFPASVDPDPPFAEIMIVIRAIRNGWVDIEWIIEAALHVFMGWNSEAIKQTVRALVRVFREKDHPALCEIVGLYGEKLVGACFTAMVDGMHGTDFDHYVKLLWKMSTLISQLQQFPDAWRNLIVAQLAAVAEEPEEGLFVRFVNHLSAIYSKKDEFRDAFANLLVMLKRLAPGDTAVFSRDRGMRRLPVRAVERVAMEDDLEALEYYMSMFGGDVD